MDNIPTLFVCGTGIALYSWPRRLFIMTRSVDAGKQAEAVSALGIATADLVHTTAAALGLSALLMTSPLAFSIVKYLRQCGEKVK